MLFSRYANPFLILDGMIAAGRFKEFVVKFIEIDKEEKNQEFYLHRVFDMDYQDFKNSLGAGRQKPMTKDIKPAIKKSYDMLNNFKPRKG